MEEAYREIIYNGKIFSASFVINSKGNIVGKHRKVHLFDIDVPGKMTFKESDILTAGDQLTVVKTEFATIGVAICYDVRFPEKFNEIEKQGAELVIVPSAFNLTTGLAHWELLMRTRALGYQNFVMAVSPARDMEGPYQAYGHSMGVAPWGSILKDLDDQEEMIFTEIDLSKRKRIKNELPTRKNK